MSGRIKKVLSAVLFLFFYTCSLGHAREVVDLLPDHPGALFCWKESVSSPHPLKLHFIMVDLTSEAIDITAISGDDPDGDGPAESRLTLPSNLLNKYKGVAAVNANAFEGAGNKKISIPFWYEGQPVDIHGMVVSEGKTVSPAEGGRTAFWLDKKNRPHIGNPAKGAAVEEAVSDWFSPLLIDSKIIPRADDAAIHPRTALGFDGSGNWLLLAVVDGRQPGYSDGITLYELAEIMKSRGCTQSINMDGGGSSIMLVRNRDNDVIIFNRPSGGAPRPVPVILAIGKAER